MAVPARPSAMISVRQIMSRMRPTVVVGISLIVLQALTLVTITTSLDTSDNKGVRWSLVWSGLGLSAAIVAAGISLERRQSKLRARRLLRAHELLDTVAASLEAGQRAAKSPGVADMDVVVDRLAWLVQKVEHVVDERRQREREVMRSDQLAMVGQMAAGVAHELRNPLTSIKMLVQTAQKDGSAGLTDEDLAIIEHEIRRLEKSLQRFLDFARPPRPERRRLNLATVVERTVALIEGRASKQRVKLSVALPADPIEVEADEDQMQQLLLNLMLNSLDVMPDGGALIVELTAAPGNQAELRVRDTGPGVPAELMPRLFDPFVSTKETGIGLGLAVSHRIAERHGGSLSADNQSGGGACFLFRLARAGETAAASTN